MIVVGKYRGEYTLGQISYDKYHSLSIASRVERFYIGKLLKLVCEKKFSTAPVCFNNSTEEASTLWV